MHVNLDAHARLDSQLASHDPWLALPAHELAVAPFCIGS
jgi:hypothetical protein